MAANDFKEKDEFMLHLADFINDKVTSASLDRCLLIVLVRNLD
jgi:hypothetical protein